MRLIAAILEGERSFLTGAIVWVHCELLCGGMTLVTREWHCYVGDKVIGKAGGGVLGEA